MLRVAGYYGWRMTIDEFQDLVDRCGERKEDWPVELREEALRFLESSPAAQAIIADAADLRTMFAAQPVERAPQDMAARIVTLAARMDSVTPDFTKKRDENSVSQASRRQSVWASIARPRTLVWLGVCFAAGIALGAAPAAFETVTQIDWPTLLAVS